MTCGYNRVWFPEVRLLLAYSDPAHGHTGGVYVADGWAPFGLTKNDKIGWRTRPNRRAEEPSRKQRWEDAMSQHTPGSWKADYATVYAERDDRVVMVKNDDATESLCHTALIALVYSHRPPGDETGRVGTLEANARLIAKAPELYELLRRYVEGSACPDDGAEPVSVIDHACHKARDLLQEIEG